MKNIVCKFGGTSLSCAENIKKVFDITKNVGQKFIVLSAPGKRYESDTKITDTLISIWQKAKEHKKFDKDFAIFKDRFEEIIRELNIDINLVDMLNDFLQNLSFSCDYDYILSRGEYFMARIFAKYTGFDFLDAKDFITFDSSGEVDLTLSQQKFELKINRNKRYVIPGFYGADKGGKIKTFSRGGSDITGAIVSLISNAKVYQNYTDVNGFKTANPKICPNSKVIKKMSYSEMRYLSYMGANVLHPDCVKFLKENNITLNLRSTFKPLCSGTLIVPDKKIKHRGLVGISGKSDCVVITIKNFGIHADKDSLLNVYKTFDKNGAKIFFMHFGIDSISIALDEPKSCNIHQIKSSLKPLFDEVAVEKNISVISVVGNDKKAFCKILPLIYNQKEKPLFIAKSVDDILTTFAVSDFCYASLLPILHQKLF